MKYAVDRIEGDIVVLQDLESKEMSEVELSLLPEGIKDGTILSFINDEYTIDLSDEEERRKRILEKMNRLKNIGKKDE